MPGSGSTCAIPTRACERVRAKRKSGRSPRDGCSGTKASTSGPPGTGPAKSAESVRGDSQLGRWWHFRFGSRSRLLADRALSVEQARRPWHGTAARPGRAELPDGDLAALSPFPNLASLDPRWSRLPLCARAQLERRLPPHEQGGSRPARVVRRVSWSISTASGAAESMSSSTTTSRRSAPRIHVDEAAGRTVELLEMDSGVIVAPRTGSQRQVSGSAGRTADP